MLRKSEDGLGLTRCGFLEDLVPFEVNLVHNRLIRERLALIEPLLVDAPSTLRPDRMIGGRPVIGYVPPEILAYANDVGIRRLSQIGPVSKKVAKIRATNTDAAFWNRIAEGSVYAPWVEELRQIGLRLNTCLLAAPVAVLTRDLPAAPRLQMELNMAFVQLLASLPDPRSVGALYSLHVHPNALTDPSAVSGALTSLDRALERGLSEGTPFWGVHLSFFDISILTPSHERVRCAKEFAAEVARIASDRGVFVWGSDLGPVGPALLDLGLSYVAYHPGMTPFRIYPAGGGGSLSPTLLYGRVLGLWQYDLLGWDALRARAWKMDDTGLFPDVVPASLRTATPEAFRVNYGKPQNAAVAERLGAVREKEVAQNGNGRPGQAHLSRSKDSRIFPWGLQ